MRILTVSPLDGKGWKQEQNRGVTYRTGFVPSAEASDDPSSPAPAARGCGWVSFRSLITAA